ncbi:hypothetical protein GCM10017673_13770 [Streptosporangium violaceochromogenes]|nr:hypothetical protein GCM10017673_13770 [Streptosporangium violaceochromogenes]
MTPAPLPRPRRTGQQPHTPPGNHEQTSAYQDTHSSGDSEQTRQENGQVRTAWEAQRAALAEAFPAWKIVCVADLSIPLWFALYREPLTPQQERAGFRPTILRGSAEDLQAELTLRCRGTRLPLPLTGP